ncbi:MAG: hypothetical protein HGA76_10665, partial [Candidatus Firestonebacteria bacterium]|nr:hypothetical protein [Candidatus Firestonebacteria bacterium]
LPLLHVAEILKRTALPAAHIPSLPFLVVCLGFLGLNLKNLWAPVFRGSRSGTRLTLACFPYAFILSLWLVWLGRALWFYVRLGEDSFWVKLLCALLTGAYAVLIAYAGGRLAELFRLTRPRP